MAPTAFKDIGKKSSGLVNDDYKYEGKAELKKAINGVVIKGTIVRSEADGNVSANVELKRTLLKVDVTGKVDNKGGATITAENATLAKGLKIKGEAAANGKTCKFSADYKHDLVTAGSTVDPLKSSISTAAAFSLGKFSAGLSSSYTYAGKNKGWAPVEIASSYQGGAYEVAANVKKMGDSISLGYHHSFTKDIALAVVLDQQTISKGGAKETTLDFAVGTEWRVDSDCSVKTRVKNSGIFSASYAQRIRPNATIKLCGEVDTSRLMRNNAHKIGIALLMDV